MTWKDDFHVTTDTLTSLIETAFDRRAEIGPDGVEPDLSRALDDVMAGLNAGSLRVAEKIDGTWHTHQWIKKAVLLYFRTHDNIVMPGATGPSFDKVPARFEGYTGSDFRAGGFRVVPGAVARGGAFIGRNVILMPSFVNIGAYVDEGTMVDTWATVGSCAQIGKHVHLSGGVGIGGVLEPLQANPTIIEDNCFIGARSEIVEGVIVEEGSVISMGVFIGQSTKIYNRETGEVSYGRVPAGSVVVAGNLPASDGRYSLYCAVIVKQVDAKTRSRTSLNDLLRYADDE
jgi:2,3,4,5-tetrahydropyridine-2-carboxylate N-succinyltransferase